MSSSERVIDVDEILFLRAHRTSDELIAAQLGVTVNGIQQAMRRARIHGTCPDCSQDVRLRGDGLLRVHGWTAGEPGNCPGSYGPPVKPPTPPAATLDPDDDWADKAACTAVDPEMFFSSDTDEARRVCAGCPVSEDCLRWAMDNNIEHGVWGGLTPSERHALKARP
jgi:WhiB family redox-sensing transcriptional regulator